jgi:hypothetical protein
MYGLEEVARQRRDSMMAEARQHRRIAQVHALHRARRRAARAERRISRARVENRARRRAMRAERLMSRALVEMGRLGRELEARA